MYRLVVLGSILVLAWCFGWQCQLTVCTAATVLYLHTVCDFFAIRQDLCQVLGTQHVPQGGLGQQPGGSICVGDVSHSQSSILDPVVHHTINTHCHGVFGQNLRAGPWLNTHVKRQKLSSDIKGEMLYGNVQRICVVSFAKECMTGGCIKNLLWCPLNFCECDKVFV